MYSDYGIPRELSDLQKLRSLYKPELPPCLQGTAVRVEFGDVAIAADPSGAHTISRSFPHTYGQPIAHCLRATAKVLDAQIITELPAVRVGVIFYGRQSPGGHNVIWGIFDALKVHNPKSTLLGFLGGSDGLFAQKTLEITDDILATYKNQGVTSNTDASQLAETFAERKCPTKVVGIPVTLNGDLKNQFVEANVGFDTICAMMSLLLKSIWVAPGHFLLVGVWELRCYQSERPFTIGAAVAAVLEAEPAVGVGKLLGEQRGYAGCLMGRLLGKGACSW